MKSAKFKVGEIVRLVLTGANGMVIRIKVGYGGAGYTYSVRMKDLEIMEFYEEELV